MSGSLSGKMKQQVFAFSYKPGNSLLHRCPAIVKILIVPVLSVLIFMLPVWFSFGMIVLQLVVALALHFTLREIYSDLKVVFFYALMLAVVKLITLLVGGATGSWIETLYMLSKLLCMMQLASIFLRTSTSLELRRGFEIFGVNAVSQTLSLFVCFIPLVSKIWRQTEQAWRMRAGKNSIKKYAVLLPVFFSVGMKQAWNMARACLIRQTSSEQI
jgi:biotin transport system permease protein/energy-coupling factor transport system permease protein